MVELNLFNLLLDSKDLNSLFCGQTPSHHFSGSAPPVTEVTHCIRPSEKGYGALVCAPHSHSGPASASFASPAAQQPGSPRPLLIPQTHQARFLEDAISTTSTHRARALCSSRARRVIDLVRRLLTGSPSPPPFPASLHCCQHHLQLPAATPHKTDTLHPPTPREIHISTLPPP